MLDFNLFCFVFSPSRLRLPSHPEIFDMFQRPLICTDFTDGLHRLVQFVPSLAEAGIQQITFLHVVPLWEEGDIPRIDIDKINAARDRLTAALPQTNGVAVKIEVESGRPQDTILKVAQTVNADVILLGTPIRSLLNEKLFGSTSAELCQRATVPLMSLRPQLIATYTAEELNLRCRHLFHHLLLPYNDDASSQYLVDRIRHYAQTQTEPGLEACTLCWVVDEGGRHRLPLEQQVQQAQSKLTAIQADLTALKLQVSVEIPQGTPLLELLNVAGQANISAIALSSTSFGKLREWSVPSFAGEVLRRSWHPVIFFPKIG